MNDGKVVPRLALFDIDGTLVREPSTEKRFALWMFLRGRIGPIRLLAYAVYSLRFLQRYGMQVFAKNKALWWRQTPERARSLACEWAGQGLRKALYGPCVDRLERHLQRGDIVVLLSGTPDFLAEAVAGELGVSTVVATRCAVRKGRFSLAPLQVHRVSEEKLSAARELCRNLGASLANASAYGNAITDLALLAACGRPVAVNPDRELAAEASRRGWEIIGTQTGGRIRASA